MPRHCSVYGCTSNYDLYVCVPTFSLPKSEKLKAEWLRKIPTDFSNLKEPVVCIKHFKESDIIRKECFVYKGEYMEYNRRRPKLKYGAVPCIFLSSHSTAKTCKIFRPEEFSNAVKSIADDFSNTVKENMEQKQFVETFKCLCEIENYIEKSSTKLKKKWFFILDSSMYRICLYDSSNIFPVILACIAVMEDLSFKVYINNSEVNCHEFSKHSVINNAQVLCELMKNVKNFLKYS